MSMNVFEIIGGIVMILMSIAVCFLVLMQKGTKGGGLSALSGGGEESFFNKNSGRTKEAFLFRGTKVCAVIFFVVTIAVYAADVLSGKIA